MPIAENSLWTIVQDTKGFTAESNQKMTWWGNQYMATELRDITGGTSLSGAQDTVTCGIFRNTCVCSPVIHKGGQVPSISQGTAGMARTWPGVLTAQRSLQEKRRHGGM